MEDPHGVQVVSVEEDHTYRLNETELEKILMKESIKNLPVAVVSVAGAFRGGKSFLLNFFIRYLTASPTARADGSWLGDENQDLTGFTWQGGSVRVTTGILVWSEPYVVTLPSGEKVAILLMDTQGTFDNLSSARDCSTVFALSSLLSSTQIYNVMSNINENDLQNLQLFTNYGQLIRKENGSSFQVLEFLVRDWMNPWEYEYGLAGGERYLKKKLQITPNQMPEIRELHEQIKNSFEKVTCFLMPHPGYAITNPNFKGSVQDITPSFIDKLKELATSIFSPENLCKKKIGGDSVKSCELINYFKSYIKVFNSNAIPTPTSILQATTEAGIFMAVKQIRKQFEENMERECGSRAPSMPASEVMKLHAQELAIARDNYTAMKLFGDKEDISKAKDKLIEELIEKQKEYIEINRLKTLRAIEIGNKTYTEQIDAVKKDKPLCVNPLDLPDIHKVALSAALKVFDENRKKISESDSDRDKYFKDLTDKYEVIRQTNDQNNMILVTELKNEYMDFILAQTNSHPNQCEAGFKEKHQIAMANAVQKLTTGRNKLSLHSSDIYESNLKLAISNIYAQMKEINDDKNRDVFRKAYSYFTTLTLKPNQISSDSCYHYNALKKYYEDAKKQTYNNIYPLQLCDINKALLEKEIENNFNEINYINDSANDSLVSRAYWIYREKFNELSSHWYWAFVSWDTARGYHRDALNTAINYFYNRRRTGRYEYNYDHYLENMKDRCENYWNTL